MEGDATPFGDKIQLYCERGYWVKISENGEISGTQDNLDKNTYLKLQSGEDIGTVKIRGLESGLYICYEDNGVLCARANPQLPGTTFKEEFCGSYNCYECTEYQGWFIGLSKKGEAKNGYKTQPKKKSTKFLPKRLD